MSYAEAAAKGPKQSPEEAYASSRAPAPPQVEKTESDTTSLVDVDSPHVSSVPADYESQRVKTTTQATRLEHEAEDKAREAAKRTSEAAHETKEKAKVGGKKAKAKAKEGGRKLDANRDNPVVIANGVILLVGSGALGLAAYKKYSEGTLDWKFAGTTAAAVGAFALADYFVSQWFFQNKYPPNE
ncbi:hypothetical protein GJ744_003458 [Endocarpon pusillum]|uniref:Mitochondrial outer membrane protein OM14 C-terminal domain-containing protein n=1 Tax=Endocarpon pusillum TaxID=364733 RepID=A0A8H7APA4_9EURO|nr:hypothetical protein GJ744_003458 [Endocarpon pusillum]